MASYKNQTIRSLNDTEIFTGIYEQIISDYQTINILCKTDQDGVLTVEHSSDSINADYSDVFNITADQGASLNVSTRGRYYRVKFENNSGSDQTYLRLSSFLSRYPERINIEDTINCTIDTDSLDLVKHTSLTCFSASEITSNGYSSSFDISNYSNVSLFGKVSDLVESSNSTLTIIPQVSINNSTWYDTDLQMIVSNKDFYTNLSTAGKYIRCKYNVSGSVVVDLHIQAKST